MSTTNSGLQSRIWRAQVASEGVAGSAGFRWVGRQRDCVETSTWQEASRFTQAGSRTGIGGFIPVLKGQRRLWRAGSSGGRFQQTPAVSHGARAERSSGPTSRSKMLRRLASRRAIVASKLLVYKLGIQSSTLRIWFVIVASVLPWRVRAWQHHSLAYLQRKRPKSS